MVFHLSKYFFNIDNFSSSFSFLSTNCLLLNNLKDNKSDVSRHLLKYSCNLINEFFISSFNNNSPRTSLINLFLENNSSKT